MTSRRPVPPLLGDPDLVDHAEGNKRWREYFRDGVINGNRAALGLPPLPKRPLLDRLLGRPRRDEAISE